MKYRTSTEIIDNILESIGSGATKTRIMSDAYLSYTQLSEYLDLLQDRDLIRYDEGTRFFVRTEKGLKFMNVFEEIKELVASAKMRNYGQQNVLSDPLLVRASR